MAFDYVPFDFERGLCQINCGGVMVTPGLCLEFWGGVTADLKLVSVDHECPNYWPLTERRWGAAYQELVSWNRGNARVLGSISLSPWGVLGQIFYAILSWLVLYLNRGSFTQGGENGSIFISAHYGFWDGFIVLGTGRTGWQLSVCTKNCYSHLVKSFTNEAVLSTTGSQRTYYFMEALWIWLVCMVKRSG